MKYLVLPLIIVLCFSCKTGTNDDNKRETQNQDKMATSEENKKNKESDKKEEYSINRVFWQFEVENGHLLATRDSLLAHAYERASLFVPPGGGKEGSKISEKVEKQNTNDEYIKLSIPNGTIEYLMLRIDSTNDALIAKKETGEPLSMLKFNFDSNSLSEINPKEYQIEDLQAGDSIVFNQNEIFVVNKNIKYLWDGKNFTTR
ncbi:MAG TPA: hypothetical protein VKP78_02850 [bacterium]|nr:hypothetical protein [bacterium]